MRLIRGRHADARSAERKTKSSYGKQVHGCCLLP
jgi:hypothetical protein